MIGFLSTKTERLFLTRVLLNSSVVKQKRIYTQLYEKYKSSYKSLHWSERSSQNERFKQFVKVGNLQGKKVLDIGSGLGDFYGFLQDRDIECDYLGVDIVPNFVQNAKKRYPNARFVEQNLFTRELDQQFDFVFASGLFAFGSRLFFDKMNRVAFELAKTAWVYNIYFPRNDKRFLSLDEQDLKHSIKSLNPTSVKFEDSYLERDLTVFLYK